MRVLIALALLCSVADAQPVTIGWRPPVGCTTSQVITWNGTTWVCGAAGSTYTAGDGLTLTGADFDLTHTSDFTITADQLDLSTAVTAPGSLSVATTLGVTGLSTLTGGFTLGAASSAGGFKVTDLANGTVSTDAAAFGQITTGTVQTVATTGTINDLAVNAATTVIRFTGGSAINLTGFAVSGGNTDGRIIDLVFDNNIASTFFHENAASVAANRIRTPAGSSWILNGYSGARVIYSSGASRWLVYGMQSDRMPATTTEGNLTVKGSSTLGDAPTVNEPVTMNSQLILNSTYNDTAMYMAGLDTQRFGIGTTSPQSHIHVQSNTEATEILQTFAAGASASSELQTWRAKGTKASPTTVGNGDRLGSWQVYGYDGAVYRNSAAIVFKTDTGVASDQMPTSIYFETAPNASPVAVQSRMRIDGDGHFHSLSGTAPTFSACGTSPADSPIGTATDNAGGVTTGTGATGCTITFAYSWLTSPPNCVVTSRSGTTFSYVVTQTTITITFITAVATDRFDWHCWGHAS